MSKQRVSAAKRAAAIAEAQRAQKKAGSPPPPAELAGTGLDAPPAATVSAPATAPPKDAIAAAVAQKLGGDARINDAPMFTRKATRDPRIDILSMRNITPPMTDVEKEFLRKRLEKVLGTALPETDFVRSELGAFAGADVPPAMGFELGGPNGEGLLDFENPNPPAPPPAYKFSGGVQANPVTRVSDYDPNTPTASAADPDIVAKLKAADDAKRAEAAADAAAALEKAKGSQGDSKVEPQQAKPTGPNPYRPSQIVLNKILKPGLRYGGAALRGTGTAVTELAAASLLGGLGLGAGGVGLYLGKPAAKWVYNQYYPPAAGAAPPEGASPAPQQQAPQPSYIPQPPAQQQDNGTPDYIQQLQRSRIGQPNSSDIIRSLSRNRGMV